MSMCRSRKWAAMALLGVVVSTAIGYAVVNYYSYDNIETIGRRPGGLRNDTKLSMSGASRRYFSPTGRVGNTTIPGYLPTPDFEVEKSIGQGKTVKLVQTIPPSMFSVDDGKILYCPGAKAGSTTIHRSLNIERCNIKSCDRMVANKFWVNKTLQDLVMNGTSISITNVRNPWDRIWSTYKGKIENGKIRVQPYTRDQPPSFVEFLDAIAEFPSGNIHWQPFSSRCLTSADDQGRIFRYDYVLRTEGPYLGDLENVCREAGLLLCNMTAKIFNHTVHDVSSRRAFYRTEASRSGLTLSQIVDKVYQIYRDDIETFNYSFDRYG